MADNIKETVQKTYTAVIKNDTGCGCSSTCCSPSQPTSFLDEIYKNMDGYQEIADYGLGCGLPTKIAEIKEGDTVLDLGSGAGNDAFIARKQVGKTGKVIGVDFTDAMIEKAIENKIKLGFENVDFIQGDIEELPIPSESIDVVISNCVMNLVPDKNKAYQEVFRVLKNGGHFSISDVVLNQELPKGILDAADMYAACVSGALEKNEYLNIIKNAGFKDIEIRKEHPIELPSEILSQFISAPEIDKFRQNKNAIESITINAKKS